MMLAALFLAMNVSLAPCTVPDVDGPARCGTIAVPENRMKKNGRKIALNTIVLPALKKSRGAIVPLQGGPGQAVTPLAGFYARVFAGAREDRDIVLIDQRGTGKSNPLNCDISAGPGLFPLQAVERCAAEVSERADPRVYTTVEAILDLDLARITLGYEKLDLFGTSYGTRVAIEYAREYPQRVRSIILKGIVPPQMRYTVDTILDTQRSLDRVRASCACPTDLAKFDSVRDALGIVVRGSLHSVPSIEKFPAMIASSDPASIEAALTKARADYTRGLSLGMYFSVTCSEDIWRVSDEEAKRETANAVGGDFWHRELAAACRVWPHAKENHEVATAFRSNIPALLVSGAYDPVTPPRWGDAAATIFTNSRKVVVENGSHTFAGLQGCVDVMMSAFVRDPDPKKVDASCVEQLKAPKFENPR